jgi:hypothetical protein
MGELGRKPVTLVEIDFPRCTRVYGSAPCTAALSSSNPTRCFNTRATCQDVPNFLAAAHTIRFSENVSGLAKGETAFPALGSVSSRPSEINLSGIDPQSTALGVRARVTVNLQDFTYADILTDPYWADRVSGAAQFSGVGYDPATRGTFLGRLVARHPYYVGLPLRVLRGYAGDLVAAMESASYVISEWKGPNAGGNVTITAKDILDLADNEKAIAPAASRGKLATAIDAVATTVDLTPATVGDEYPASGSLVIGREIVTYTRSGDTLTLTARGTDGTVAASHAARDVAQVVLRYDAQRPCDVISDLLQTYAGVDAAYIDLAAWQAENDSWLGGLVVSAIITKPTGVSKLIGEICQLGVLVWWDEIEKEIRYQANRPLAPGETFYQLNDATSFLRGSIEIDRADDQRISAIYLWHGVIDPTESTDSDKNFSKLAVAAVSDDPYEQAAFKSIYCRWFGPNGDDAAAGVVVDRLLGRFQTTPIEISATLDVKDKDGVRLAALTQVSTYLLQDAGGASEARQMQVTRVEVAENRVKVRLQTYGIEGRFGFWMDDADLPDYATDTDAEKATGAYWMDEPTGVFPDGTGPFVYF